MVWFPLATRASTTSRPSSAGMNYFGLLPIHPYILRERTASEPPEPPATAIFTMTSSSVVVRIRVHSQTVRLTVQQKRGMKNTPGDKTESE